MVSILAIIPARGGSKGVVRKNIRMFAGKPLIAWTIKEAKKSKYITRTILSSEDPEIIDIAKQHGCDVPFVRPLELAQDDTPGIAPVLHAIEQCPGYDYVVLLQPTSPLRKIEDIDGCIEYILEQQANYCVSVSESEKSPYWMYTVNHGNMKPLFEQSHVIERRQDLPDVYALNGAIYVAKVDALLKERSFLTSETKAYIMSKERSLDIDTEMDFFLCEQIFNKYYF
ncbi:acylneuraminate cytidylyltransferase family protein [Lysinibacillus capsici]|uniref:acylneuraminate cytidylyltransferase family protein n=1 Tax=Lysinibacillus TaxID=400634 RepID=UPI00214C5189|nr:MULTISPECIES: acylneuraminate cytidylyltransferase family protein [Lysinibacillus]UUV25140.1 acylneuraminate cytidylyltransferase family protein [Lysinibacillus sp. FN11]UYB48012.1 acylneuraminate cytidylyltransferase family protein [Lysinibacillus capsici]